MKVEKDVIDKELHLQQQKLALPDLSSVSKACVWMQIVEYRIDKKVHG